MLFYVKRWMAAEIGVTALLVCLALWGIHRLQVPLPFSLSPKGVGFAIAGSVWLGIWTLLVQHGYRLLKGRDYAHNLTGALAKYFADPNPIQVLLAGITAWGEELFFRGLIQQKWGLLAGALAFMAAHIGKKDIRVISYWSVFQGLYLGLFFAATKNLVVPMVAHGLFDIGGMMYFRSFMARVHKPA